MMSMNCEQILELLHEGIDGELEGERGEQFRVHLEECPDCARQAESIRRLKKLVLVKVRREPVPPGLERRIREILDAETAPTRLSSRARPMLLSAAALLIVGLTAFVLYNDWRTRPPVPRIAHATVVSASEAAAAEERWTSLESATMHKYLRNTFGMRTSQQVLDGAGLTIVGWAPHLFDDCVAAVRMKLEHKRGAEYGEITCFAFRGEVFADATDKAGMAMGRIRERILDSGKVCCCSGGETDHRVICFESTADMHIVFVLDGKVADGFLDLCDRENVDLHKLLVRN